MTKISLDYQMVSQTCDCCGKRFNVSRGSLYEDGDGIGIYLAAMHSCHSEKTVRLAITLREEYMMLPEVCCVAMDVWPTETKLQMLVTDAKESPWGNESYLGRMMDREESLNSPLTETFFHLADHVVVENPAIAAYLME
jgi:hypothetical protein